MTAQEIAKLFYSTAFRFCDELTLQCGIERLLTLHQVGHTREVILSPKDRIDFMVDRIGIEVKVDSPLTSVQRQLWRYAEHECIDSLILVTTRSAHKQLPNELLNKPLLVVHILAGIF